MPTQKKVVFICGCPRSGTTLLGSLLGGGKNNVTTPESQFIIKAAKNLAKNKIKNTHQQIKNIFLGSFRFKLWNINAEIQSKPTTCGENPLTDVTWQCVNHYALKLGKKSWDTWIDHTPIHINHVDFLAEKFPNSYFIHLVRDGRGAFSSVKPLDWGPNGVIEGSKWWGVNIAAGLAAEQLENMRIIRVHFEDLVRQPEEELLKICELINIKFDPLMLEGGGFSTPAYTKKQHNLIGKPPDKSICDKWKNNLSSREIEIFEKISGSILRYLGYELVYGLTAKSPNRTEQLKENLFLQTIKKFSNESHQNRRRTKN